MKIDVIYDGNSAGVINLDKDKLTGTFFFEPYRSSSHLAITEALSLGKTVIVTLGKEALYTVKVVDMTVKEITIEEMNCTKLFTQPMKISNKHINISLWLICIACMIFYVLFCIYIIFVCDAQFEWNATPKSQRAYFSPIWCGSDISAALSLIFNCLLPLHLLGTIGLIIQCIRSKVKKTSCLLATIAFLIFVINLIAWGSWLYANYIGIESFGERIWWI